MSDVAVGSGIQQPVESAYGRLHRVLMEKIYANYINLQRIILLPRIRVSIRTSSVAGPVAPSSPPCGKTSLVSAASSLNSSISAGGQGRADGGAHVRLGRRLDQEGR
jgi:hypothetical protein